MSQLNRIAADAAQRLLVQQGNVPKYQPENLGALINFSQILAGLIKPSEASAMQAPEPAQVAEPSMIVRERPEEITRSEQAYGPVRETEEAQRTPKVELLEGPDREAETGTVASAETGVMETADVTSEQVALAGGQVEVVVADTGNEQVIEAAPETPAEIVSFESGTELFEPEIGPTEDIVAPSVSGQELDPKQEMIDFLSERSLGMEKAPVEVSATPEQTSEKAAPDVQAAQVIESAEKPVQEFRSLVADEQTEQQAQDASRRPVAAEPQDRPNLTAAKPVLFEEVASEKVNSQAQNAAHPNPVTLATQVVTRVNVPAADVAPQAAAVATPSETEGVPGVKAAQAAEGAPTAKNEAVRVNQAEIIERIVRLTKSGVNRGKQEVRLVLNPPELGGMKVHLKIEHGTLDATIRTDTLSAHQLVSSNLAELRNGLIEAGLDVGYLEVLLTGEEAGNGHHSSFEEHLEGRSGRSISGRTTSASRQLEAAVASAPSIPGMSLIDITV